MKTERKEAGVRILVAIITGIILGLWAYLVYAISIINFFVVLFSGKRNKEMAETCEYWNTVYYEYYRYLTFVSNKRPFPFADGKMKRISKFK